MRPVELRYKIFYDLKFVHEQTLLTMTTTCFERMMWNYNRTISEYNVIVYSVKLPQHVELLFNSILCSAKYF